MLCSCARGSAAFWHAYVLVSPLSSLQPQKCAGEPPLQNSLAEGEPVEFKRMEFNGRIQASDVTGPDGSYVQGTLPPSADANKDDF